MTKKFYVPFPASKEKQRSQTFRNWRRVFTLNLHPPKITSNLGYDKMFFCFGSQSNNSDGFWLIKGTVYILQIDFKPPCQCELWKPRRLRKAKTASSTVADLVVVSSTLQKHRGDDGGWSLGVSVRFSKKEVYFWIWPRGTTNLHGLLNQFVCWSPVWFRICFFKHPVFPVGMCIPNTADI